jgi:hypothetical protein
MEVVSGDRAQREADERESCSGERKGIAGGEGFAKASERGNRQIVSSPRPIVASGLPSGDLARTGLDTMDYIVI